MSEVLDTRTVADFQTFTFSGHSRSQVLKSLSDSIRLGHADYACFWSLELLCSGLVHSLWSTLFECTALHIHRMCPNAVLFVTNAYERFATIEGGYSMETMTNIRNNIEARDILCRTASVLALCRKEKLPTLSRIKPEHDFTQATIREMMKATTQHASARILKQRDPYELQIPINEYCYHLLPSVRDAGRALYWVSWIFAYCREHKKTSKQSLSFAPRENEYVDAKYATHPIWFFWDGVWDATETSPHRGTIRPYIEALYKMHNLRWEPKHAKARTPYLIAAIIYITESNSLDFFNPANHKPSDVETNLESIPRWIETILQTRNSFSSR